MQTNKNCLIFYGQLRTFKKCIPNMLKFINYDNIHYDIYMCIDKSNDVNYSEENVQELLSMFGDENRIIRMFDLNKIINQNEENILVQKYFKTCDEIKQKYPTLHIITNKFVTRLYYRRASLLQHVNAYITKNNLAYNTYIFTRFDINMERFLDKNECVTNPQNKLHISFDTLFIGTISQLLKAFQFSRNYFAYYQKLKQLGDDEHKKWFATHFMQGKYNEAEYYRLLAFWICMPELNFHMYLLNNNIEFNKLEYVCLIQR